MGSIGKLERVRWMDDGLSCFPCSLKKLESGRSSKLLQVEVIMETNVLAMETRWAARWPLISSVLCTNSRLGPVRD